MDSSTTESRCCNDDPSFRQSVLNAAKVYSSHPREAPLQPHSRRSRLVLSPHNNAQGTIVWQTKHCSAWCGDGLLMNVLRRNPVGGHTTRERLTAGSTRQQGHASSWSNGSTAWLRQNVCGLWCWQRSRCTGMIEAATLRNCLLRRYVANVSRVACIWILGALEIVKPCTGRSSSYGRRLHSWRNALDQSFGSCACWDIK